MKKRSIGQMQSRTSPTEDLRREEVMEDDVKKSKLQEFWDASTTNKILMIAIPVIIGILIISLLISSISNKHNRELEEKLRQQAKEGVVITQNTYKTEGINVADKSQIAKDEVQGKNQPDRSYMGGSAPTNEEEQEEKEQPKLVMKPLPISDVKDEIVGTKSVNVATKQASFEGEFIPDKKSVEQVSVKKKGSSYSYGYRSGGYSGGTPNMNIPNGAVGKVAIPAVGLSARVNSAPDMLDYGSSWRIPALRNGAGIYPNTSEFDGLVGLAGHRNTHFRNLHKVKVGDIVYYNYQGQMREYEVTEVRWIDHEDWSGFMSNGDNEIVLTTCEKGRFAGRLLVKAVEVGSSGSSSGNFMIYQSPSPEYGNTVYVKNKKDSRYRNGHHNDVVDGNVSKVQDPDYQDNGYNDPYAIFNGMND